jgi:CubicO group peptidase (beta-lactamase class C family)
MLPTSLVFAASVLAGSSAPGQAVPALPRVRGLDAAAQGQLEAKGLPGLALAVLEGDELVHLAGYGRAAIGPERTVEADTPFELASISKQFAAAAVMRLVEEGRLDLDQEVKRLLPELRVHGGALRVRHLLGQTSGLPELLDLPGFETLAARPSRKSSLVELLRAIAGPPLRFPPDSFWAYSNSNYTALAVLVERASSKPYARFLKDLLKPLGLEAIAPCHTLPRKGRAVVYRSTAEGLRPVPPDTNPHTYTGNGDLCGTARDLARWTRALAAGRVVSAESYRRMVTPGPVGAGFTPPYGYGLSLLPLAGRRAVSHTGSTGAAAAYFPESGTTIVVLTNRDLSFAEEPLQAIARAHFGLPAPPPPDPGPVTSEEAAPFVGNYDDGLFRFRVFHRGGRLVLDNPPFGTPRPLGRVSPRRFASVAEPEGIAIELADEKTPGLALLFDWAGKRSFARRTAEQTPPAR